MSALEPGMARISHPDSGVEDAVVPASAVPHWEFNGWKYEEGDRETWPEELQRFEGQNQVRIYHPELDRYETVAESAVPHHRSRGWVLADQAEAEQLEAKTVEELREEARSRGLKVSGTKDELIERLRDSGFDKGTPLQTGATEAVNDTGEPERVEPVDSKEGEE